MTVDTFKTEVAAAQKAFEKFIVCLEKSPAEFEASLRSLVKKAIRAYETRGEGMRHGIALDGHVAQGVVATRCAGWWVPARRHATSLR